MTYNQIKNEIQQFLQSHAMIKDVRFATPIEWLGWDNQPSLPVALFSISNGSYNVGRELIYNVQFWFLDKSGVEGEFETEVISDQLQIACDMINYFRQSTKLTIDDNINFDAISEKFEDYLSGVTMTFNFTTINDFNSCDIPFI